MIVVTGNTKDVFGVAVNGTVIVQLCNFGGAPPRVAATALIAKAGQIKVPVAAGAFSMNLYGNDTILPAGTYYAFTFLDEKGNVVQTTAYQFNGAGPFDLSSTAPFQL